MYLKFIIFILILRIAVIESNQIYANGIIIYFIFFSFNLISLMYNFIYSNLLKIDYSNRLPNYGQPCYTKCSNSLICSNKKCVCPAGFQL